MALCVCDMRYARRTHHLRMPPPRATDTAPRPVPGVPTCAGSHKERFDEDGQGMGAAGRVQNTGGIHDLSQVANRNNAHTDIRGVMH